MGMINEIGGKKKLVLFCNDQTVTRSADDGGGIQTRVENTFKSPIVAVDWGKGGHVIFGLADGTIHSRDWKDGKAVYAQRSEEVAKPEE